MPEAAPITAPPNVIMSNPAPMVMQPGGAPSSAPVGAAPRGAAFDPRGTIMQIVTNATAGEQPPVPGQVITPTPPVQQPQQAAVQPHTPPAPAPAPTPATLEASAPVPGALPDELFGGTTEPTVPASVTPAPAAPAEPAAPTQSFPETPPKDAHVWAELRYDNKRLKQELESLKNKPETTSVIEELEMLKTKNAEYEQKIGQLDLASSREFQMKYDLPIRNLKDRGVAMLTRLGIAPEQASSVIATAMKLSGSELQDFMSDLQPAVQSGVLAISTELAQLTTARETALGTWREERAALGDAASRDYNAKLSANIERDTVTAMQTALKEGNWMLRKLEGEADGVKSHNDAVEQVAVITKGILRNAKSAELVKYIVDGVTAPRLRDAYKALREQNQALMRELRAVTVAQPRAGITAPPAPMQQTVLNSSPIQATGGQPLTPKDILNHVIGIAQK